MEKNNLFQSIYLFFKKNLLQPNNNLYRIPKLPTGEGGRKGTIRLSVRTFVALWQLVQRKTEGARSLVSLIRIGTVMERFVTEATVILIDTVVSKLDTP